MGVFDLFRPASQVPAQPQQPQQQQQPQGEQQQQQQQQQEPQPTGLDAYNSLFTPDENDAKLTDFDPNALFSTTPEAQAQLAEEISKLNFVSGAATPEILEAIQAGGDDAIKALPVLMNKVAQAAFDASLKAAMQINKTSLSKAAPAMESRMSEILRRNQVEESVRTANPVLNHPSGKVIADALVNSFMTKYPNASPAELKEKANQYIMDIAGAGVPKSQESSADDDIMSTDWSKFLN